MFDLLSGKAAIAACHRAMARHGRVVPIQAQVTIELTGRMLPGHRDRRRHHRALAPRGRRARAQLRDRSSRDVRAAAHALGQRSPCRCRACPTRVFRASSTARCTTTSRPDDAGRAPVEVRHRVRRAGRRRVLRHDAGAPALASSRRCDRSAPPSAPPSLDHAVARSTRPSATSRTARCCSWANGRTRTVRRSFRDAMLEGDWDTCVGDRPRADQRGRARPRRLRRLHRRRRRGRHERTDESARDAVVGAHHGRHDRGAGRAPGPHLARRQSPAQLGQPRRGRRPGHAARSDSSSLAAEFGAAVVATCIDEEGQARTAEWKVRAARAITDLAVSRYGLDPHDIFIDTLALPLSTGMVESRRDGIETIEAIRAR